MPRTIVTAAIAATLAALAAAAPVVVSAAPAPTYSFALNPPNEATSLAGGGMAAPGDRIVVTGAGTFTPATKAITASGTFVHYADDGSVRCKGTWRATALTDFIDFGPAQSPQHGGRLSLVTSHSCRSMGTHDGVPMTVTSTLNAPRDEGYVEGTTVAEFTQPTSGGVTIWRTGA